MTEIPHKRSNSISRLRAKAIFDLDETEEYIPSVALKMKLLDESVQKSDVSEDPHDYEGLLDRSKTSGIWTSFLNMANSIIGAGSCFL